MRYLYAALVLLLGFVATGFLRQNPSLVTLAYGDWKSPELPLALVVLLSFAGGFALALVLGLLSSLTGKVRLRRAEREADRLAAEVARLAGEPGRERQGGPGGGSPAPR